MRKLILIMVLFFIVAGASLACTTAIVSGKFTHDGRPLMWKQRDNDVPRTKLVYLSDGKYDIIGLVNATVVRPTAVWYGFNSAGFAIMNTMSYNIDMDEAASSDRNGTIMLEALRTCESIAQFEEFLTSYERPLKVQANFGTIDAFGEAAYFEVNNDTFVKIDVNDPRIAPHGYIVRTNYSFTGSPNDGAGYIRFQTAENLFYRASGAGTLTIPWVLEYVCRSLANSYTGQNVRDYISIPEGQDNWIYYQDCINRYTSTSSIVVQGVKPGESPLLTTMWAIIGSPLSSMVVPVWLNEKKVLPSVVSSSGTETPDVCEFSLILKDQMVPSLRGSTKYYINTTKVFNANGTGITQRIIPLEKQIIARAEESLAAWRLEGRINQSELGKLYDWVDTYVRDSYRETFGLESAGKGRRGR